MPSIEEYLANRQEQEKLEQERRAALLTKFVRPATHTRDMRETMQAHLLTIVAEHNRPLADKIHFLRTGERRESVSEAWARVMKGVENHPAAALKKLSEWMIDLEAEALQIDDSLVLAEDWMTQTGSARVEGALKAMRACDLLELYGRVLFKLRSVHLKDSLFR